MNLQFKLLTLSAIAAFSFSTNVNAENQVPDNPVLEITPKKVKVFDSDMAETEYVSGVVVTTEVEVSKYKNGSESYLSDDGNCYKTTDRLVDLKKNEIHGHVFYTADSNSRTVLILCPPDLNL